jgi:hypothetical protein
LFFTSSSHTTIWIIQIIGSLIIFMGVWMRIKILVSRKAAEADAYSHGFVDGATEAVRLMTRHPPREHRPEVRQEIENLEAQFNMEGTDNE